MIRRKKIKAAPNVLSVVKNNPVTNKSGDSVTPEINAGPIEKSESLLTNGSSTDKITTNKKDLNKSMFRENTSVRLITATSSISIKTLNVMNQQFNKNKITVINQANPENPPKELVINNTNGKSHIDVSPCLPQNLNEEPRLSPKEVNHDLNRTTDITSSTEVSLSTADENSISKKNNLTVPIKTNSFAKGLHTLESSDEDESQKSAAVDKTLNQNKPAPTKKRKLKSGSSSNNEDILNQSKFHERKQKYKKKISANLEKNNLIMSDFIHWNPSSNPMPNRQSRSNSQTDDDLEEDIDADLIEETEIENGDLIPPENTDKPEEINQNVTAGDLEEEEEPSFAPQLKIGPNGKLVIDEKSLTIRTTAAKNRDKVLSKSKVVEELNDTSHNSNWSKRRKRSIEWTKKETKRFYKALSTVGTDFSLMHTIFAHRTREELKKKYKKEDRCNRHLIEIALKDCTQFDFTIFDESDYDPEEDRKQSKKAEKEAAKEKREYEKLVRKKQRVKQKEEKRELKLKNKKRKRLLKEIFKHASTTRTRS